MAEIKKPTTYDEQLQILKDRGCIISDVTFCKEKLAAINYYRLTAYFLPFRKKDGNYKPETSFHRVYRIYEFDRKLRGILFSAIEDVEIYLRSHMAYFHAHKYGALGYLKAENFSAKHNHEKFEANFQREIDNNKQVLFVKHHIEKYSGQFPIWVICELFTFGMLSYFYNDMTTADQKFLAADLYNTVPKNMKSWLRCCTDLRNMCAHYGRLYFRIFPAIPGGIDMPEGAKRRLWGAVLALKAVYPHSGKWNSEVLPAIESLFEEYKGDIDLRHIAFPDDWTQQIRK